MEWIDTSRSRGTRDRCISGPVPEVLPMLGPEPSTVLRCWVRSDGARRSRAALLKEAAPVSIEVAEALCDVLLRQGWIVRQERLVGGAWQWTAICWRDLARLQMLLGVSSPRLRVVERQALIDDADAWLASRAETADGPALDPDLLDELSRALMQLREERSLRLDLLETRLQTLRAAAGWHDEGRQGSRRDFSLYARGGTKALGEADWRWLEAAFDLERLRIARFAEVGWFAGKLNLFWNDQQVQLGGLHCLGLPLADLMRVCAASQPERWWLIENRASFERQAQQLEAGVALIWMPGRPSIAWLETIAHLLRLAPAPAWISADADPSGVDIACTVGAVWQAQALPWQPHRMAVAELVATAQHWPLNDHDRRLIDVLLARTGLPQALRELCLAMQREGRKAEQEAWI